MRPHVRIRKDYVKLIRQKKIEEAQILLEKIWVKDLSGYSEESQKVIEPEQVTTDSKYNSLSDLSKINGIGTKTVKDIKRMFKDMNALKKSLKNDTVGLRDDIVEKLVKEIL